MVIIGGVQFDLVVVVVQFQFEWVELFFLQYEQVDVFCICIWYECFFIFGVEIIVVELQVEGIVLVIDLLLYCFQVCFDVMVGEVGGGCVGFQFYVFVVGVGYVCVDVFQE